jgi:hypothetical protein
MSVASPARTPPDVPILGFRLAPRFGPAVDLVRARLTGLERALFDLLSVAGHLGQKLPNTNANTRTLAGMADPRRELTRLLPRLPQASSREWTRARVRLVRLLAGELSRHLDAKETYPLHVLLGSAPIALAPDCVVPAAPILLTAWKTVVSVFARVYSSSIEPLGQLAWLDATRLAALRRETLAGRARGRRASGMRPGRAGRELAVDPRLMRRVGRALGITASPGYEARYIFYTKDGDYFWPHPDDPEYPVNVLVCLDHQRPNRTPTSSALLAYRPDGSLERYELTPGSALAVEARGLVHAREPMRRGERMTMLSIAVKAGRHQTPSRARRPTARDR